MKGKIYIIKPGIGKIIYDNKESEILSFPKSFEDSDEVEFNLVNGKFLNIIAYSKDNFYGKVIGFVKKGGVILVSYPSPIGTIIAKEHLKKSNGVKFRIKKYFNGSIEAVNILEVDKAEFYKTDIPKFGTIKEEILIPKESFISDIVSYKKPSQRVYRGVVKRVIKKGLGFGFVTMANGKDIYFTLRDFIDTYKIPPKEGDRVEFFIESSQKGDRVKKFYKKEPLPYNQQYAIIDNKKVSLHNLKEVYKKVPEVGDIVFYIENDNKIILKNSLQEVYKRYIFFIPQKNSINYEIGKIKAIRSDKGFGFISLKNGIDVFFLINNFKRFYKKEPKVGEKVYLTYKKSFKGYQADKFLYPQKDRFYITLKDFKNFYKIESNELYFGYFGEKDNKIYRYDKENLNQSIAAYKDKNTPLEFKLKAINTMLKNNYTSKNISKDNLLKDKKDILIELVKKYLPIDKRIAFLYEVELQKLILNKDRLRVFRRKNIKFIEINKKIEPIKDNFSLNFIKMPKNVLILSNIDKLNFIRLPSEIELIPNKEKINFINIKEFL